MTRSVLRRAVFLDRDGVINRAVVREGKPYPPATLQDFELLPGVVDACEALHRAGFLLIVATNQPDVGRGTQDLATVEAMHDRLRKLLPLDGIEVCYDSGDQPSDYLKPAPGMLLKAALEYGIDLKRSFMVGDRWRDVDCGQAAGCQTFFIDHGYEEPLRSLPDFRVSNLPEAATILLSERSNQDMNSLSDLRVHIYSDGASKNDILAHYQNPLIKGLTTNPTLMKKAGVVDYEEFARDILETVISKPISFEVFSDEFPEMRRQALKISGWQDNVFVKIPITNSRGESSISLISDLVNEGVKINVTALLTVDQVRSVAGVLLPEVPAIVSVFGGRIADTGQDPVPVMNASLAALDDRPLTQLLWASCREVLNIRQADKCGAHIITVTNDILQKALKLWDTDPDELSLATVQMFHQDAHEAGYKI